QLAGAVFDDAAKPGERSRLRIEGGAADDVDAAGRAGVGRRAAAEADHDAGRDRRARPAVLQITAGKRQAVGGGRVDGRERVDGQRAAVDGGAASVAVGRV